MLSLRKTLRRISLPVPRILRRHSSASSTRPGLEWEEGEEPLRKYNPAIGGYRALSIGDILGSRYTVVRKLGWGVYSTVWLARLDSGRFSPPSFRALKVLTRVATDLQGSQGGFHELEFLQCMRSRNTSHPGYAHVVHMLDYFNDEDRPHGRHLCLAMEPMLEDMHSFATRWLHNRCPPSLLRLIGRQVVSGLQYLHEECDIAHTDVKPSNIFITPPENTPAFFSQVTRDELGVAESTTAIGPDGLLIPRVRSDPIPYPAPPEDADVYSLDTWKDFHVKLGDVGAGCWADRTEQHYTDLIQSPSLRAPEVAVGAGWGKPADIWSLGCTLWELYIGAALLSPSTGDISVPMLHAHIFGDYPPALTARGKYRHVFFNPDGSPKHSMGTERGVSFDAPILRRQEADAALFVDFLRRVFVLDPDGRATCAELLAHPWLNP